MKIARRFTVAGQDAYQGIDFRLTTSEIRNPDGSIVFQQKDVYAPAHWSQVAVDVLVQKYFRRKGVPTVLKTVPEERVPVWLWRKAGDEQALAMLSEGEREACLRGAPIFDTVTADVVLYAVAADQATVTLNSLVLRVDHAQFESESGGRARKLCLTGNRKTTSDLHWRLSLRASGR